MTYTEQTLAFLQERGIASPRDLIAEGIPPSSLYWLHRQGKVMRTSRGVYFLADGGLTENHSFAEVCKRVSHGIICLASALRFHEIGTQAPFEVWLAIDHKAHRPQLGYPPLRVVRFSGLALSEGVEEHRIEGVAVRVYNPAKTIADCFKYRHKIGLDVALEAMQEGLRYRKCTHHDLWRYAKICRVANIMLPYLEATV